MSERFKHTYRGYLVDHHSPPPPVVTFEHLDIADYERFYDQAHINNLMLYCKDHWGYSYYDTEVGVKHPALRTDWVKEHSELLKRKNIEFNAYYCIEYDNTASVIHPEWASLQADGSELRCTGRNAKWRIPCYLTGYRQYVLSQLREIVSWYTPDSLFLDIFGKSLCYCPTCRAEFERRNGFALPEEAQEIAKHSALIIDFLDDCAEEFLSELITEVKAIDPELAVTINFSSHYRKSIRDRLDYHFTEPWAGNWLSAAYARATGVHPQLGPGDVSHVFDYLPSEIYEQAASEIAAQGCRVFLYSEPQLPDGTLEFVESERIGTAFSQIKSFEHLLEERTHIADVCIIQSDKSVTVGHAGSVVPNAIARARAENRHVQSLLGAMRCCEYSNLTWTVLPEQEALTRPLESFSLIILPQVLVLEEPLLDRLYSFIEQGGHVILIDRTGLYDPRGNLQSQFSFQERFGISFDRIREEFAPNVWGGYADFGSQKSTLGVEDTTVPISSESILFTSDAHSVARFVPPAETLGAETWVNWGYPPPRCPSTADLVVTKSIGEGSVWYYGFDVTSLAAKQMHWPKEHLSRLFGSLIPHPAITLESSLAESVGFTAFRTSRGTIHIHIISHLPELTGGDAPEFYPGKILVQGFSNNCSATLIHPTHKQLKTESCDGVLSIELPMIRIQLIIEINEER